MELLKTINGPGDVKRLSRAQLDQLADEIRERIIGVTSLNGGHIGPNLGVVELTLAMHRVFNTPQDRFVFDVSHQGYVHKLLTGRSGLAFDNIRKSNGLSGFLNRKESEHDCYGAGHAGTALSAALGMAIARDRMGGNEHVVAMCGDAAFTCGITMEALNNVASQTERLVIVLNDNEWSIDKNVGAISNYLNNIITDPLYRRLHDDFESFLHRIPGGESIIRIGSRAKKEAKDFFVPSSLFEKFGIRYIGPVDGHDIDQLMYYLEFCRDSPEPVILHVLTQKGRGYPIAIEHPEKFHGTSPFEVKTGMPPEGTKPGNPAWQKVFGEALLNFARADKTILGITAAMPSGTSLSALRDNLPEQYIDVGIAEEHAVLSAAGMATRGLKPVCAIYSTFLQRAFDCLVHDVSLQELPVTFCMDRAGVSPNDGATHHGLYDISYSRILPDSIIMQPRDGTELVRMMRTAIDSGKAAFVRYPRGSVPSADIDYSSPAMPVGKAEVIKEGEDIIFWALGPWVEDARQLADALHREAGLSVGIVNARFVKPLDTELLTKHARGCQLLVTLEDHTVVGGFGSAMLEALQEADIHVPVERIGWPDRFCEHASNIEDLRKLAGLDPETIKQRILKRYRKVNQPSEVVL